MVFYAPKSRENPMRRLLPIVSLGVLYLVGASCLADESTAKDTPSPLVFTSFRRNGQDGLHLAWSNDGYAWASLNSDKPLMHPEVGGGLMRDPQILQGPDGTFHMVWTTAWNKHGIGYANSKDLIHWSKQKLPDVMQDESEARNVWAPELFCDAAGKQFMIFFVYFDRYTEGRYGPVTSKDLVHWEEESDNVRLPSGHRHGSVLRVRPEVLEGLTKR
jgi:sucrose-6-phosphate hydrolase SacC (GH32 family)